MSNNKTVYLKLVTPRLKVGLIVNAVRIAEKYGWTPLEGDTILVHSGSTTIRATLQREVAIELDWPFETAWNCRPESFPSVPPNLDVQTIDPVLSVQITEGLAELLQNSPPVPTAAQPYENETWEEWDNGELGQSLEHARVSEEDLVTIDKPEDKASVKGYTLEQVKAMKWVELSKAASAKFNILKMKRPEIEAELVRITNL